MFDLDGDTRGVIKRINTPFSVLIAEDDNRVDYKKVHEEYSQNKQCHFISFASGKHVIHYGKNKDTFFDNLSEIPQRGAHQ
jgi:esterase/lipase